MHIEQDIPALRQKHYAVMSKELAEIQRRRAELHSSRDTPTSSQAATESPSLRRKALASRSRRWRGFKDRDSSMVGSHVLALLFIISQMRAAAPGCSTGH